MIILAAYVLGSLRYLTAGKQRLCASSLKTASKEVGKQETNEREVKKSGNKKSKLLGIAVAFAPLHFFALALYFSGEAHWVSCFPISLPLVSWFLASQVSNLTSSQRQCAVSCSMRLVVKHTATNRTLQLTAHCN